MWMIPLWLSSLCDILTYEHLIGYVDQTQDKIAMSSGYWPSQLDSIFLVDSLQEVDHLDRIVLWVKGPNARTNGMHSLADVSFRLAFSLAPS